MRFGGCVNRVVSVWWRIVTGSPHGLFGVVSSGGTDLPLGFFCLCLPVVASISTGSWNLVCAWLLKCWTQFLRQCLALALISDKLLYWVMTWSRSEKGSLGSVGSLFLSTKSEIGRCFLNKVSILLILEWARHEFGLANIVNSGPLAGAKLGVTISLVNWFGIICTSSRQLFTLLAGQNAFELGTHGITQASLLTPVLRCVSTGSRRNGPVLLDFVVDGAHGVLRSFNCLLWDLILPRSNITSLSQCHGRSLAGSEAPLGRSLQCLIFAIVSAWSGNHFDHR